MEVQVFSRAPDEIMTDWSKLYLFIPNIANTSLYLYNSTRCGRLAQLARAPRLHRGGRGFEPLSAHQIK